MSRRSGWTRRAIRLLKDLLRQQADGGTTVFLSTHSLDIAQELADRIGIVDHGRLIGCGTLDALRKQADMRRHAGRGVPEDDRGSGGGDAA